MYKIWRYHHTRLSPLWHIIVSVCVYLWEHLSAESEACSMWQRSVVTKSWQVPGCPAAHLHVNIFCFVYGYVLTNRRTHRWEQRWEATITARLLAGYSYTNVHAFCTSFA